MMGTANLDEANEELIADLIARDADHADCRSPSAGADPARAACVWIRTIVKHAAGRGLHCSRPFRRSDIKPQLRGRRLSAASHVAPYAGFGRSSKKIEPPCHLPSPTLT
jgi:hypothetical protein